MTFRRMLFLKVEHSKTVIEGLEYNTLHGTFGDITLVYLQSESGNGLFVYDAAQNAAYEFVRINSESHFIVVLLPKVDDVPEGYNEISLSIEARVWQQPTRPKSKKPMIRQRIFTSYTL